MPNANDVATIRNSLFFNSAYYLEKNRDVRAAGLDAAVHYLVHGGREGRDPGPFFSTKAYLARYPDVAEADVNALLHYETRGRRETEWRLPLASADPVDLAEAVAIDVIDENHDGRVVALRVEGLGRRVSEAPSASSHPPSWFAPGRLLAQA